MKHYIKFCSRAERQDRYATKFRLRFRRAQVSPPSLVSATAPASAGSTRSWNKRTKAPRPAVGQTNAPSPPRWHSWLYFHPLAAAGGAGLELVGRQGHGRSAMDVSSVSPQRWVAMAAQPFLGHMDGGDSLGQAADLVQLDGTAFATFSSMPRASRSTLVTRDRRPPAQPCRRASDSGFPASPVVLGQPVCRHGDGVLRDPVGIEGHHFRGIHLAALGAQVVQPVLEKPLEAGSRAMTMSSPGR